MKNHLVTANSIKKYSVKKLRNINHFFKTNYSDDYILKHAHNKNTFKQLRKFIRYASRKRRVVSDNVKEEQRYTSALFKLFMKFDFMFLLFVVKDHPDFKMTSRRLFNTGSLNLDQPSKFGGNDLSLGKMNTDEFIGEEHGYNQELLHYVRYIKVPDKITYSTALQEYKSRKHMQPQYSYVTKHLSHSSVKSLMNKYSDVASSANIINTHHLARLIQTSFDDTILNQNSSVESSANSTMNSMYSIINNYPNSALYDAYSRVNYLKPLTYPQIKKHVSSASSLNNKKLKSLNSKITSTSHSTSSRK